MAGGMVSVVWSGIREMNAELQARTVRVHEASRRFVVQGLALAERNMKIHAGEGGRHAKGTPTPASKGSGPAVVTGQLRGSIRVGPIVAMGRGYAGDVGPTAIYGRRIELEYDYPYAGPGWAETVPELPGLFAETVGAAHRG